ncbi:MAG: hypothetical protein AVDCRST_MAG01-01-331, partial [uncultured Rubrobacteraceae bacterium]
GVGRAAGACDGGVFRDRQGEGARTAG